jgi:hypothetical protein
VSDKREREISMEKEIKRRNIRQSKKRGYIHLLEAFLPERRPYPYQPLSFKH